MTDGRFIVLVRTSGSDDCRNLQQKPYFAATRMRGSRKKKCARPWNAAAIVCTLVPHELPIRRGIAFTIAAHIHTISEIAPRVGSLNRVSAFRANYEDSRGKYLVGKLDRREIFSRRKRDK